MSCYAGNQQILPSTSSTSHLCFYCQFLESYLYLILKAPSRVIRKIYINMVGAKTSSESSLDLPKFELAGSFPLSSTYVFNNIYCICSVMKVRHYPARELWQEDTGLQAGEGPVGTGTWHRQAPERTGFRETSSVPGRCVSPAPSLELGLPALLILNPRLQH